jgi:glutamate-1-semialdehyde 2,1-aminomutase
MDSVLISTHPPLDEAGPEDSPVPIGESAGMVAGSLEDVIVAPWNNLAVLERIFERQGAQIACVIMEPILCNCNTIMPHPGYLEGVRSLCDRYGSLFIFDEVITGFRLALGGAQELTGVIPDLATYAKALAGGFPVAMLLGRTEIMGTLGEGTVYHGGSFNSNVMTMSAAEASLKHIMVDSEGFYRNLNDRGRELTEGLQEASKRAGSNLLVQTVGSVLGVAFSDQPEVRDYREVARYCDGTKYLRFVQALLERGVRVANNGRWHISSAHTGEDIETTVSAAYDALRSI